jgi:LysR family glycine cleavage system transcriptional activator
MSTLPPLAAIRAFEAASRHLSFTRAGEELGMTQAAVSYQIRLLEDRLGVPLFLRKPRQLQLTEAGERLAPELRQAFDLLRNAFDAFDAGAPARLTISTTQSFAAQWLAPRLGRFTQRNPNIAVELQTESRLVDFSREAVDIAIRQGKAPWPGLVATHLFDVTFTPMLSPDLAASVGGITKPADLLALPLLDPRDPWWRIWFEANDLPLDALERQTTPTLNSQSLTAAAAMGAQGVALLTPAYFVEEVAKGRLLRPFDTAIAEGSAFWLVIPESRRNARTASRFRDWLMAERAAGT